MTNNNLCHFLSPLFLTNYFPFMVHNLKVSLCHCCQSRIAAHGSRLQKCYSGISHSGMVAVLSFLCSLDNLDYMVCSTYMLKCEKMIKNYSKSGIQVNINTSKLNDLKTWNSNKNFIERNHELFSSRSKSSFISLWLLSQLYLFLLISQTRPYSLYFWSKNPKIASPPQKKVQH